MTRRTPLSHTLQPAQLLRSAVVAWCVALALAVPQRTRAQDGNAVLPVRVVGPSAREVVRMVLKAAHLVDPERVALLVRRARLAGLSPTLRVGAERGLSQDLSSSSSSEAERQAAAVADDFSFDATLTFDLSRLVFAPEEVRLLSVQRWLSGDQRKLAEDAVQLYFKRRKLLLQERTADAAERLELALAIEETEALLDALTDGAYARALTRAQKREARPTP
jgi:hypothetical protein